MAFLQQMYKEWLHHAKTKTQYEDNMSNVNSERQILQVKIDSSNNNIDICITF